MKIKFAKIISLVIILAMAFCFAVSVSAASPVVTVSLSSSKSSVRAGNTFTVTVKLNIKGNADSTTGIYSFNDIKINYNSSLVTLQSAAPLGDNSSQLTVIKGNPVKVSYNPSGLNCVETIVRSAEIAVLTFKVNSTAAVDSSAMFSVNNPIFKNIKGKQISSSSGGSITVNIAEGLSADASLKGIIFNEGVLSPEFDPDITEYSTTIDNKYSKLSIIATPSDNSANINITGNSGFKVGQNKVYILVTAPSGNSKKYSISVKRLSSEGEDEEDEDPSSGTDASDEDLTAQVASLRRQLTDTKNRNLIIILVLIFVCVCELFYILIEKYGERLFGPGGYFEKLKIKKKAKKAAKNEEKRNQR